MPVNFIKLLRWNIIKQMQESVVCVRFPQNVTRTLYDID